MDNKNADDETDVNRRDGLDALPWSEHVDDDRDDRRQHDADEDDMQVGIGELVLADDPAPSGRAKPADHQHEDGPNQYQKHGDITFSDLSRRISSCDMRGTRVGYAVQTDLTRAARPRKPHAGSRPSSS